MPTNEIALAPPLVIGGLRLDSRYTLAPLAGYTNIALRLALRELGGMGLATSDLVNARALLMRSRKTLDLIATSPEDRPLSLQIYGKEPAELCSAAQWLESYGVSIIDINMGCPVHKITRGGGGAALMCEPGQAIRLVEAVVQSVQIPVTVKMRLGWDEEHQTAPYFARVFEEAGVAAVTIHGRTRAQGFGGSVNLVGIRAVVEAVRSIPVIGNGDVHNRLDAERMLRETGCAGIAIGRGALLNPWIFSQMSHFDRTGEELPLATWSDRLGFMRRHYHLLITHRGEHFGSLLFRKVANWYCRILRPGHALQQRLMMIENAGEFERIVEEMRSRADSMALPPLPVEALKVPKGPMEHW